MEKYIEILEKVIVDLKKRNKRLEDWFLSVKGKGNTNNGLLDLISNETELTGLPIWRKAFEVASDSGIPNYKDIWMIDDDLGLLFLIPKGSYTAQCLSLKELLLFPKEEILTNTLTTNSKT